MKKYMKYVKNSRNMQKKCIFSTFQAIFSRSGGLEFRKKARNSKLGPPGRPESRISEESAEILEFPENLHFFFPKKPLFPGTSAVLKSKVPAASTDFENPIFDFWVFSVRIFSLPRKTEKYKKKKVDEKSFPE